jgi:hypothetical protein
MRGERVKKMFVFVNLQGMKTLRGVKKLPKSVHVVVE